MTMIKANPLQSDPFSRSVRLLRELHLLTIEGKDESEAADEIRSAMDTPWRQLSSEEQVRLEGLSADLYSIGVDRIAPDYVSDELAKAFQSATETRNPDAALAFLREHEMSLPASDVAALRGICWDDMQQLDAASLFYAESLRIKPNDFRFLILHLRCLVRSNRLADAQAESREIAGSARSPYELLLAADILFACASQERDPPDLDELRQVIEIASRAVLPPSEQPPSLSHSRVITSAYLAVASSRERLGDRSGAQAAYQMAKQFYTEGSGANAARRAAVFGAMQPGESFLARFKHVREVVDADLDRNASLACV